MERDHFSRLVFYIALAVAGLWGVWALLYETTGIPGINYLTFGFVSLPVGSTLFAASFICYLRARTERRATSDAVGTMFLAVGIAVVPFVALLQLADYS